MANAVVILGAGSSADFGVPVLSTIFSDRHAQAYLKKNMHLHTRLNELFWQPRGHDLVSCDTSLNVEQMLTILKDWEREPTIAKERKPKDISEFRRGLYVLIEKAVFEGKNSKAQHLNPIIDFCHSTFDHTTWASFNWDCIFESSFWYHTPWGLGPYTRKNPSLAIPILNWHSGTSKHLFLKLHGGINWWLIDNKINYFPFSASGTLQPQWEKYDNDPSITDRPVILEPSFYKYDDATYNQLAAQWTVFFERMITADYIIIIGYSLPEMDTNARSRIMTAFQYNETARWLVIDPSEQVCNLYSKLLGHNRTTILEQTLASFNNDIKSNIQAAFPLLDINT